MALLQGSLLSRQHLSGFDAALRILVVKDRCCQRPLLSSWHFSGIDIASRIHNFTNQPPALCRSQREGQGMQSPQTFSISTLHRHKHRHMHKHIHIYISIYIIFLRIYTTKFRFYLYIKKSHVLIYFSAVLPIIKSGVIVKIYNFSVFHEP